MKPNRTKTHIEQRCSAHSRKTLTAIRVGSDQIVFDDVVGAFGVRLISDRALEADGAPVKAEAEGA